MNTYEMSERERFQTTQFDQEELEAIAGAVNRYGFNNPCPADPRTLMSFTWEQVLHALNASKRDSKGDAQDEAIDLIFAVREARHATQH